MWLRLAVTGLVYTIISWNVLKSVQSVNVLDAIHVICISYGLENGCSARHWSKQEFDYSSGKRLALDPANMQATSKW